MNEQQIPIGSRLDVLPPHGTHRYWSTHCRHDNHDLCKGSCKGCAAPCICGCGCRCRGQRVEESTPLESRTPDPQGTVHNSLPGRALPGETSADMRSRRQGGRGAVAGERPCGMHYTWRPDGDRSRTIGPCLLTGTHQEHRDEHGNEWGYRGLLVIDAQPADEPVLHHAPGNGDLHCPRCRECVNLKCWKCGWARSTHCAESADETVSVSPPVEARPHMMRSRFPRPVGRDTAELAEPADRPVVEPPPVDALLGLIRTYGARSYSVGAAEERLASARTVAAASDRRVEALSAVVVAVRGLWAAGEAEGRRQRAVEEAERFVNGQHEAYQEGLAEGHRQMSDHMAAPKSRDLIVQFEDEAEEQIHG